MIVRADRGSQYTAAECRELCGSLGVNQSMCSTGVCWDNALGESFFATDTLELTAGLS